jgi:DNA-directed RNA polymerase subunit RPC12/RpoP
MDENEKPRLPGKPTEAQDEKGFGVATGALGGLVGSGCLVIVGILLTLTGIGALIGIPLILLGLAMPFVGGALGLSAIKGPCPYCGHAIHTDSTKLGLDCPACKQRIVIKDKKFYRIR